MSRDKSVILFVDDEENMLRGLMRMMRTKRDEWDAIFAHGGNQALSILDERDVDVVISDMHMPGMDGADLFRRIKDGYPETVRIVLSGYAEKEAILKTIGPSHQYLAKPCDQDLLIGTIQRSLKLRSLLGSSDLRRLVLDMSHVPTLPDAFNEILRELDNEYASAESFAEKVAQDVGVATYLMKLTNSAYFGLPIPAKSPIQAINFLGFENVKATFLMGGIFDQLSPKSFAAKIATSLSRRSIKLGLLARTIASSNGSNQHEQEQAYCAGLVAHIGTLLLVANWPEKFRSAINLIYQHKVSISEAENQVFDGNHGSVGAYLLGLWGFNDPIVEAVAYHHNPSDCNAKTPNILLAVHVAQHLLRAHRNTELEESQIEQSLDEEFVRQFNGHGNMGKWIDAYEDLSKEWPNE